MMRELMSYFFPSFENPLARPAHISGFGEVGYSTVSLKKRCPDIFLESAFRQFSLMTFSGSLSY